MTVVVADSLGSYARPKAPRWSSGASRGLRSEILAPNAAIVVDALVQAIPELDPAHARLRLLFATQVIDQVLAQPHVARTVLTNLGVAADDGTVIDELIAFLVGGLTATDRMAPPRKHARRGHAGRDVPAAAKGTGRALE